MANTDKQNFRYDKQRWQDAVAKTREMQRDGYDIDMTRVLSAAVDELLNLPAESVAFKLRIEKTDGPVTTRRRPRAERSSL